MVVDRKKALENWKNLVNAVHSPSSSASFFHAGELESVPSSLTSRVAYDKPASQINDILQVAHDLEKDYRDASAFLFEHALLSAQNLDPNSEGRGVLQFKTGLISRIRATKTGRIPLRKEDLNYRKEKIETLQKCYMKYRQEHSSIMDDTLELEDQKLRRKKFKMILRVLQDVIKEADELVTEEFRREMKLDADELLGDPTPYNILPLEGRSHSMLLEFPEVKAARDAIKVPIDQDGKDIFDVLHTAFGFQPDNLRNQREHLVLLLANTQSRRYDKEKPSVLNQESRIRDQAINYVYDKILENYKNWCSYIREKSCVLHSVQSDYEKLALVALYLCIWGEAANVRFLPECICYIFHNMARELLQMLQNGRTCLADSCKGDNGVPSFLKEIITPVYKALKAEASRSNGGKAAYSEWRNYDDFNEFFWSHSCSNQLKKWPSSKDLSSSFFHQEEPIKKKGARRSLKKTSFVEHRTFLHLYHSFVRVWILLVMMLQGLVIMAFTEGLNLETLKILLSLGPTYFMMKLIESVLDIVMMFGAYSSSRCDAIVRIFTQFLFYGGCTGGLSYLYWQLVIENPPSYFFFKLFLWILGSYVALKLLISLCQHTPSVREQVEKMNKYRSADAFMWLFKERFYVGRGLFEKPRDHVRYVLFWAIVLACKFTFSYYFQIEPLAKATKAIFSYDGTIIYAWHDFVSKNNHNALALFFLWAPVVLIYLLDIQIWYTVFSAILGGVIGVKDRLGEIRTLDMLQARFHSFPENFIKYLQIKNKSATVKTTGHDEEWQKQEMALIYAPFWNNIILYLRKEDYIANDENDLLIMPSKHSNTEFVEWPLFLLASKVSVAIKLATEKKENRNEIFKKVSGDKYMSSAVAEAFESVYILLNDMVADHRGREFFNNVRKDVKESIKKGPDYFFEHFITDNIETINRKVQELTKLLDDKVRAKESYNNQHSSEVDKAVLNIYEAVLNFLQKDERENYKNDKPEIICRDVNLPTHEKKEWIRRLHLLLTTTESGSTVPKNGEARRRLEFFTNSLFMRMPLAPSVRAMKSFSVLTPYYNEYVVYSVDDLNKENEDGINILFYLQKIFPDEWKNFLERLEITEKQFLQLLKSGLKREQELELRLWASYRGQTLARTVRGMMYYRKALELQALLEASGTEESTHAQALADYKFTYVVSCQMYGQQKASGPKTEGKEKANDILHLLSENEGLRIAYIDIVDDGKGKKSYYSKLVKSGEYGTDQVIYSIKLPGDPILGEGKPENQNHAIIFTRGDALQTIDMNQDYYFEEALKMRNLLEEFEAEHGIRFPTILGVREHIFTGSVSSLAWFMSNQETSFVTLGQRVLARPLKVRMHYGHPDVFDRLFHLTRGGISKASKTINVSEDIFAGFNSTLRRGNVTHHEYIQVGKGRDVGLNQIAMFEAKVSSGNGEQLLSRDVYRLGQLFDFFRMLSFYVTAVGYYACTMMTTLVVYFFLYGKVYLALSGVGKALVTLANISKNQALQTALDTQFMFQIGIFTAIPMVMVFILEQGAFKAVVNFITMQLQLCSVFFTFSLGTRTHYFGQTVLHGGAKYQGTGRGFVVQHIKFANNYRLYSRSHFVKALEIVMLLIVIKAYGYDSSTLGYFLFSFFSWFLAISWLFAPYIFNPSGFEWQKTVEDFDDWMKWLLYRGGVGVTINDSWETWWNQGQEHIRSPLGRISETILSLRFFIFQFGVVYHLKAANDHLSLAVYGVSWLVLGGVVLIFLIFFYGPSSSVNYQMLVRLIQGMVFIILTAGLIAVLVLREITFGDVCAIVLALVPTGWGILSIAIAWRPLVKQLHLWKFVRRIAWAYDAAMAMIIFLPIAILSWFPFVSTFQTRLLFNQAFSRGLEISLILAGNRPNVQASTA